MIRPGLNRSDQLTLLMLSLAGMIFFAVVFLREESLPDDPTCFPDYSFAATLGVFDEANAVPNQTNPFFTYSVSETDYAYQVDLNRADHAELDVLPGLGPKLVERIIEHRTTKGPYRHEEDVLDVRGIGPKKFAGIRPFLIGLD